MKLVKLKMFDSMVRNRRTGDIWIKPEPAAKVDLGKLWDGHFAPMVAKMDPATRDELARRIANYGNELGKEMAAGESDVSGLAFGRSPLAESPSGLPVAASLGSGASPTDINDANKTFWDNVAAKNLGGRTADALRPGTAHSTAATPDAINRANREFYARQPQPAVIGGKWGKR